MERSNIAQYSSGEEMLFKKLIVSFTWLGLIRGLNLWQQLYWKISFDLFSALLVIFQFVNEKNDDWRKKLCGERFNVFFFFSFFSDLMFGIYRDPERLSMFTGRSLVHLVPTLLQSQREVGVACAPPCFGHMTWAYEDGGSFFFLEVKPRLKPKHPPDRGLGIHRSFTTLDLQPPLGSGWVIQVGYGIYHWWRLGIFSPHSRWTLGSRASHDDDTS